MEEITQGINEINKKDLEIYNTVKLYDLTDRTQITFSDTSSYDSQNNVIRILIKSKENNWYGEVKLKLNNIQDSYLESLLSERKKYINDIIKFTKEDFYIVTIALCKSLTVKEAIKKCENIKKDILQDLDALANKKLNDKWVSQISEKLPIYKRALNKVKMEIKNFREESEDNYSKINQIKGRIKEIGSIEEKVYRKNISLYEIFEKVDDIAGARVVCEYLSDVYELADYLTKHPIFKILSFEDKIKSPTSEGYRGIHINLMTDVYYDGKMFEDIKVELQILTAFQNTWATKTHNLTYKNEAAIPQPLIKQMRILGDLLYKADKSSQILKEDIKKALSKPNSE